jgi:PhnB protein
MALKELPPPPPLAPYLTVDNAKAAIDFYARAFGAVELSRQPTPNGDKLIHAALSFNGGLLMLSDDFPEMAGGMRRTPKALGGTSVTLHLDVPDVDSVWKSAVAAGATVTLPLAEMFWGDRYGKLRDPFGHEWSLATRKQQASQAELDAGTQKHFG